MVDYKKFVEEVFLTKGEKENVTSPNILSKETIHYVMGKNKDLFKEYIEKMDLSKELRKDNIKFLTLILQYSITMNTNHLGKYAVFKLKNISKYLISNGYTVFQNFYNPSLRSLKAFIRNYDKNHEATFENIQAKCHFLEYCLKTYNNIVDKELATFLVEELLKCNFHSEFLEKLIKDSRYKQTFSMVINKLLNDLGISKKERKRIRRVKDVVEKYFWWKLYSFVKYFENTLDYGHFISNFLERESTFSEYSDKQKIKLILKIIEIITSDRKFREEKPNFVKEIVKTLITKFEEVFFRSESVELLLERLHNTSLDLYYFIKEEKFGINKYILEESFKFNDVSVLFDALTQLESKEDALKYGIKSSKDLIQIISKGIGRYDFYSSLKELEYLFLKVIQNDIVKIDYDLIAYIVYIHTIAQSKDFNFSRITEVLKKKGYLRPNYNTKRVVLDLFYNLEKMEDF